ncbi:hypothetical protein L218DRAFT_938884 [Marasmius fiardii PR-910]|nr:hypothetical protein L218DRAFT_938884 [Marasmius fiardii PR-910]
MISYSHLDPPVHSGVLLLSTRNSTTTSATSGPSLKTGLHTRATAAHRRTHNGTTVGSQAITLASSSDRKRPPSYFCQVPGCTSRGFTTRHAFEYHQRSHLNIRPFRCSDCSRGFGSRSDLKRHQKRLKGSCAGFGLFTDAIP